MTTKLFEDTFSELQADMVSVCLEYVNRMADRIYIYCSCELDMISCNFFFCVNGKAVRKHKLDEIGCATYNTSSERQDAALRILSEDTKKLLLLCEEHNRPMPTEIKLVYDIKTNHLDANYRYELIRSHDPSKTSRKIFDEWFTEVEHNVINLKNGFIV